MHSFLVVTKDKKTSSSYVTNFLKQRGIDLLDINWETYEKAVGIEDIRNVQKKVLLKPFKGKTKAIVIEALEGITTEAQNALLKTLEEPPANTIIVITVTKKELILPTIISRCEIIVLKEKDISLDENDLLEFNNVINILLNGKIGDKLKIAQDVTMKKDTSSWLEKLATFAKNKLTENYSDSKYLNILKEIQKTYEVIKSTNVNQRIALENLFLSF